MEKFKTLSIFNNNLKYILDQNNITQKELSIKTNTSCATINNYINKCCEPSVSFLLKLKENFGYSLDELIETDISKLKNIKMHNSKNLDRFLGNYIMYFYNSGEYKGKVSNYSKNTLKYALISIFKNNRNEINVLANFIKHRDDAEDLKNQLDNIQSSSEIASLYKTLEQTYEGTLDISDTQIFIYLKNETLSDQSLIILNNPPSKNVYLGGLGTANSVSRGREHMPCVQFALLSRKILKIADGEIYNMLALGVSDINVETETEQLINLFKNLYIHNENLKDDLSAVQKRKIVENSLNAIVTDLIDANMFRFAKISNMEDDDYYRIIKDE